jgi:drug/metabolite transporter (DMT)-like permease
VEEVKRRKDTTEAAVVAASLMNETYTSSIQSVNLGFALASALAWNDAVKMLINKYIPQRDTPSWYFIYAGILTFLAALVFTVSKMFFKPSLKRAPVTGAVLGR